MGRKKISTTIYLEQWQAAALAHISETSGVPQAKMIRDAIDGFLEDRLAPEMVAEFRADGLSEMDKMRNRLRELEAKIARNGGGT